MTTQRTPQTESHLAGMAAAADRSNRPLLAVVIAAIILVGSIAFAGVSYMSMSTQGKRLRDTQSLAETARKTLQELTDLRASFPDLPVEFAGDSGFYATIRDHGDAAFTEAGLTEKFPDPQPSDQRLPNSPMMFRIAKFKLQRQPLAVVLDFVSRVLADADSKFTRPKNIFLSSLRVQPDSATDGWNCDIEFRMLQYQN